MKIIYKKGALPKMTQTLRRGEILGVLVDQSRKKQGVPVTFFGREATATPAAALLAIRCKSPVVPDFVSGAEDGQLTIRMKEPLEVMEDKDLRSDLQTNTQRMTNAVEEMVGNIQRTGSGFSGRGRRPIPTCTRNGREEDGGARQEQRREETLNPRTSSYAAGQTIRERA